MDQTVIAGVGNVYRSELLFRHGIDPVPAGPRRQRAEFDAAWTDLVALMKVGLRGGKIIVVRPEHDHGPPSYAAGRPRTYVYRRAGEPCRVNGRTHPHDGAGGSKCVLVPDLSKLSEPA